MGSAEMEILLILSGLALAGWGQSKVTKARPAPAPVPLPARYRSHKLQTAAFYTDLYQRRRNSPYLGPR